MAIAKKHELWVIEDSACGFGATYGGQHVGNFGNAGVFSFHPRKAITTVRAAWSPQQMPILPPKPAVARSRCCDVWICNAILGPKLYLLADHIYAGYNQRMTDIQGALGASQMDRANEIITERRRIAKIFDEAFAELDDLKTPFCAPTIWTWLSELSMSSRLSRTISEGNEKRNSWMEMLQNNGISTRPATHAVHMLSFYKDKYDLKPEDFPNAYKANHCSISLPLFHGMTALEQDRVISVVKKTFPTF